MDLHSYLIDGVVHATTPRGETEAGARDRRDAIVQMLRAFHSSDAMEAMIACHCVTPHFLVNAAMRDAADITLEPKVLIRARAGAMATSRTYRQWISKFEALKKRNEVRAAEAREAAKGQMAGEPAVVVTAVAQTSPATPEPRPHPSPAARPVIQAAPDGPAANRIAVPGNAMAAAANGAAARASGQPSTVHPGDRA